MLHCLSRQKAGLVDHRSQEHSSTTSKTFSDHASTQQYLQSWRLGCDVELHEIWLTQLPSGGGAISLEELKSAILLEDGDSRICQGSVCHTDGARTYKQLGDVDSPLLDREVFDVEFSDLHLAHTAVKHSHRGQSLQRHFRSRCGLALLGFRKRDKVEHRS